MSFSSEGWEQKQIKIMLLISNTFKIKYLLNIILDIFINIIVRISNYDSS
jgi:hypothetical protein